MRHLAIFGGSDRLWRLAVSLREAGFTVTLLPASSQAVSALAEDGGASAPRLMLMETSGAQEFQGFAPGIQDLGLPWLALLCESTPHAGIETVGEVTTAAYRAGALAVLPADSTVELVEQAVIRAMESLPETSLPAAADSPRQAYYRAGMEIPLRSSEMMRVLDGVVAQVALHEDGTEGLVGLWGPGHLLSSHPEDACCLLLRAHTEVLVETGCTVDGSARESLLQRIQCLEAWSSMQSRQSMEQRLLGLLALLAEQFGETRAEGTVIEIRVTHAQLATAIGATRATVTRLLGRLRRRGLLSTLPTRQGERICLLHWHLGGGARMEHDLRFLPRERRP